MHNRIMPYINSVSKDIVTNIIANIIPVAILQLVALPYIARNLGDEKNGLFLTILAILHFIIPITSGTLSTAKLLLDGEYKKLKQDGDFNLWLSIYSLLNIIVVVVGCLIYSDSVSIIELWMICTLSLIWMIRDYLLVEFRLSLIYKKILSNNVVLALGLFIGILVFEYIPHWYTVFFCGYCAALIHALISTTLIKEPFKKTILFSQLSGTITKLTSASILGMLALNLDRLLLFPLAGGTLVSIYYSASIIGKIMMLISSPISNVFLSYFVKINQIQIELLHKIFFASLGFGILTYIIILSVSPFLLDWLYPLWSEESLRYVPITSAVSAIELVISITNPIVLRFCGVNCLIRIQTIYFVFYITIGLIFYHLWGLFGFATGVVIASTIKAALIYYYSLSVFQNSKKQFD